MPSVSPERLAEVFVEMADTLVADFDLIDFLHTVTVRTAELVDTTAVGLLLADHHGTLQVMAASDEQTKLLELFQVQHSEGPCLDAFTGQSPVVNADLSRAGERWPLFAPRATDTGFRSVHAIPLRLRAQVIGALNLFSVDTGILTPADVSVVQALADVATIGLLQERAIHRSEALAGQLQSALNTRVVIEQAKGALAVAHGISVDAAFTRLRGYARNHNLKLSELATAVIRNPGIIPELTPL